MTDLNLDNKLKSELNSFKDLWEGGNFVGNPWDPLGRSAYNRLGYMSILHVVYLTCIKPFINKETTVIEIGPGRGAWTKTFLQAKEVWCLDALSAEHNNFWKYIGNWSHVRYFQVEDFSCSMLPENTFDYLFSFGTLCHISFDGITEYMKHLYTKLRTGANCFIMIADYEKLNLSLDNMDNLSVYRAFIPNSRYKLLAYVLRMAWQLEKQIKPYQVTGTYGRHYVNEDTIPRPGRWYHAGTDRTCKMLEEIGYTIINPDLGIIYRDPIIYFKKVK